MRRSYPVKTVSVLVMAIIALMALASSTCLAQEDFSRFKSLGMVPSSNLTPPSDKSWVFFDLPFGKYRFDTSVQIEQMDQNKVSPVENDRGVEQSALTLHFSIRW